MLWARTEKLRALGQMAAGVSHDLRQMKGVVTRGVDVLERLRHFSRQTPESNGAPPAVFAIAGEIVSAVLNLLANAGDAMADLTTVFARHVDAQEKTLFPSCAEQLDPRTFEKILEDVSIASFHLAASARLKALRA